jgi:hypothetical protein
VQKGPERKRVISRMTKPSRGDFIGTHLPIFPVPVTQA